MNVTDEDDENVITKTSYKEAKYKMNQEENTMKTNKRNTFRHLACFAAALMLLLFNVCCALADSADTVTVTMDLQLEKNLIFAKYNVSYYVDEDRIDLIANGGRSIKVLELSPGIHTITLYAQKSGVPDMSFDFTVAEDTSITATIQAHRKYMTITSLELKTANDTIEYDESTGDTDWVSFVPLLLYSLF